jgi:hypothetical protein
MRVHLASDVVLALLDQFEDGLESGLDLLQRTLLGFLACQLSVPDIHQHVLSPIDFKHT